MKYINRKEYQALLKELHKKLDAAIETKLNSIDWMLKQLHLDSNYYSDEMWITRELYKKEIIQAFFDGQLKQCEPQVLYDIQQLINESHKYYEQTKPTTT